MVIRREQLRAFEQSMYTRFVARLTAHLRLNFARELASRGLVVDDQIRILIAQGIEQAQRYGVINEPDVERYVECMVVFDPHFDSDDRFCWARDILSRQDIDGESKMDQIDEYLIFGT